MILNLDSTFKPHRNKKDVSFEHFTFPGGEPHLKITSDLSVVKELTITHRIRSFNDMGLLLLAVNAVKNMGVTNIHLLLPYFPAARQDRLMTEGEPLTVKIYAELINQLNLTSITIFDPHSEVAPALLDRCKIISNFKFIKSVTETLSDDLLLISPDGGALKKIYKLAAHLQDYDVIECSKSRDIKTGKLSGFKVYSENLNGKDCLIVDDICDGGGTFLGLAKALKAKSAGRLYLAVSHGIFSKGLDELSKYFEIIFTTDAFKSSENKDVVQTFKLQL